MSDKVYYVGDRLPYMREKIIFRAWCGDRSEFFADKVGYVTKIYPEDSYQYRVRFSFDIDGKGPNSWLTHYSLADDEADTLVSPDVAQKLTDLVLKAADARGYCQETENILADIGFPTKATKYRTIKFKEVGDNVELFVNGSAVEFEEVDLYDC